MLSGILVVFRIAACRPVPGTPSKQRANMAARMPRTKRVITSPYVSLPVLWQVAVASGMAPCLVAPLVHGAGPGGDQPVADLRAGEFSGVAVPSTHGQCLVPRRERGN